MLIIAKDAEQKILDKIHQEDEENSNKHCLHIPLSKAKLSTEYLFDKFLHALDSLPDSYMAQVYICEDKDIFIFMAGFMQRPFDDFLRKFSVEVNEPEIAHIGHFFEIQKNADHLEHMCLQKMKSPSTHDWRDDWDTQDEQSAQLPTLNPELVSNIEKRREQRTIPLILIVDDDELSRTLAQNSIEGEYEITLADDGSSALRKFVEHAPDIVFLDIGLPDMSGHDVLEYIFQVNPNAYVIMFSGRNNKENIMRAMKIGAQGFLSKPFTREKLNRYITLSPLQHSKKTRNNKRSTTNESATA